MCCVSFCFQEAWKHLDADVESLLAPWQLFFLTGGKCVDDLWEGDMILAAETCVKKTCVRS